MMAIINVSVAFEGTWGVAQCGGGKAAQQEQRGAKLGQQEKARTARLSGLGKRSLGSFARKQLSRADEAGWGLGKRIDDLLAAALQGTFAMLGIE